MKASEISTALLDLFEAYHGEEASGEHGFYDFCQADVQRIGYATNLTPETVQAARTAGVQMMLVHHDAWSFVFGMQAACVELLKEFQISCLFVHDLLDDSEFGTNASLIQALEFKAGERFGDSKGGLNFGMLTELSQEMLFEDLVRRVELTLGEPVKAWKNRAGPVRKIAVITGAGMNTSDVKLALDQGCDTYITGEKILYTVQYAAFAGINLIVGSHTFTEIFGVRSLAEKAKGLFPQVSIVQLPETHLE